MTSSLTRQEKDAKANHRLLVSMAFIGDVEEVKNLISQCDPLAEDYAALSFATQQGHPECVKLLLPYVDGKNINYFRVVEGAAWSGELDCLKALLPLALAHFTPSQLGECLAAAAKEGHLPCVELLWPNSSLEAWSEQTWEMCDEKVRIWIEQQQLAETESKLFESSFPQAAHSHSPQKPSHKL